MTTSKKTHGIGKGWRGLSALLVAQFMGAANDNILKALLSFAVVSEGGMWKGKLGEGGQGLIALCLFVPFIFFSGWAGPLADRHSKRTIAVWMKWLELPFAIVAGIGFVLGNFWLTAIAMVLLAAQSTFFSPAKYGMIPELVSESAVSKANGLLNMSTNIAVIAGMLIAGFVSVHLQPTDSVASSLGEASSNVTQNVWLPSFVLVAVAVVGVVAIVWLPKLSAQQPKTKIPLNPIASYISTLREMWKSPIMSVAIAWSLFDLLATVALLVIMELGSVLKLGSDVGVNDQQISYLLAAVGIALGIGSLAAGYVSRSEIRMELSRWAAVSLFLILVITGLAPAFYWIMLACLIILGLSAGFYAIPLQALMQTLPNAGERGRVLATTNAIAFSFMALGSLAYWGCRLLFDESSPQYIFIACSGIAIMAWFICKRIPQSAVQHTNASSG